jgi:hypothetical protein
LNQNETTLEPPNSRLPNMAANTLGLYRMLKGGSKNEEWGHADGDDRVDHVKKSRK